MRYATLHLFIVIIIIGLPGAAIAQHQYGHVDLETSCNAKAGAEINTAAALLHHMMYEQAEEGFRKALEQDPSCAMAQWGIAMTQLHPLWAPPTEAELEKGKTASAKAKEMGAPTERERAYIDAIAAFFHTDGTFLQRLQAWETGQRKVHEANPEDVDAAAFFALSRLATAPRDDHSFAQQAEAGKLLESLLENAPEHPGLFHYTIHAYDNPKLADQAVRVARAYDKLAPEVPHALHMPSHIFVRLGLWDDVASWNRRSADAALKHSVAGTMPMHFAHAIDYLVYSRLQKGADEAALENQEELFSKETYQGHLATAYALAAVPARYALERRDWKRAAELAVREPSSLDWDKFPAAESITWFAKGVGAARSGDAAAAEKALSRLNELHAALIDADESYWAVLTDAQRKSVEAWMLREKGKTEAGVALMREAADVEDSVDKHPVTPSAVLPARELLGEMLLMNERPSEALEAFEASLAVSRNRLNSLSGAGRAAELAGDSKKAAEYYADVLTLVKENEVERPRIAEARRVAGGQ